MSYVAVSYLQLILRIINDLRCDTCDDYWLRTHRKVVLDKESLLRNLFGITRSWNVLNINQHMLTKL